MTRFDYDLFTIGAGSGGVRASRMAGQFGAKVAIAEHDRIGGTCVIRGCIPKKLLSYVCRHLHEEMGKKGVRILLKSTVSSIARRADGTLEASVGGGKIECDAVMVATGRT